MPDQIQTLFNENIDLKLRLEMFFVTQKTA